MRLPGSPAALLSSRWASEAEEGAPSVGWRPPPTDSRPAWEKSTAGPPSITGSLKSPPSGLQNVLMRLRCLLTGSPHCWLRWSRWDLSPCFHPWWETFPRSTSAAAAELWSRSPSGRQMWVSHVELFQKSWIDRMWDTSGSHPLVIRVDSYSHYPASRQTSKLSVLELQRQMQRKTFKKKKV